jgi:hypothetical protein
MDSLGRVNRRFRWRACCHFLAAASCSACLGCASSDGQARRWLDPLGLTTRQAELSEQPEFRKRVANDPFPAASQVGLATPPKAETK